MAGATIITGASNGIGRTTARWLAEQGLRVFNLDLAAPKEESEITDYEVDLSKAEDTAAVLDEITSRHRVTRLINNVAFARASSIEDTSFEDLTKMAEVNLRCTLQCTQAVLPGMKAAGFGRIVNITSRAALGRELRTSYAATKGGVISMTRVWALELAPYGITVNAIGPGPIATDTFNRVNPPDSPRTKEMIQSIPVRRIGCPEDVAHAVSFFVDEKAGYVTGQVLYTCGGLSVGVAPI